MESGNLFYKIYEKKSSEELEALAINTSAESESRLIACQILENRNPLSIELAAIKNSLLISENNALNNEISPDRYDTFLERFFALFIDGFILWVVALLLSLVDISQGILSTIIQIIASIAPYVYNICLHGYSGQTIGKYLTGVKVYDKSEVVQISYYQAFLRDIVPLVTLVSSYLLSLFVTSNVMIALALGFIFAFLLFIWAILEIVTMLFNEKRRALHDLIAGTVVLKLKKK